MTNKFPCMGCAEREPGCHGKCERYRAARKEHDERARREKEGRPGFDECCELRRQGVERAKRRHR